MEKSNLKRINMKYVFKGVCLVLLMLLLLGQKTEVKAQDAVDMNWGQKYSGTVKEYSNPEDTYKFILDQSGYVTFELNMDNSNHHYPGGTSLLNSYGVKLWSEYAGQGVYYKNFYLNEGSYYFKVDDGYGLSLSYTLSVTFEDSKETFSYENEYMLDVRSQKPIPFSTSISCQLSLSEENDYYKCVLPQKGSIILSVDNRARSNKLYVYVYDKNANLVGSGNVDGGRREYGKFDLKKGTYYIRFAAEDTGKYKFDVSYNNDALSGLTVKKISNRVISVKSPKAGSISGFEIRYKKNSQKWNTIKVPGAKKLNKKIKKLSPGAKYTIQVRTYFNNNGNILYSNWSKKKSVKMK